MSKEFLETSSWEFVETLCFWRITYQACCRRERWRYHEHSTNSVVSCGMVSTSFKTQPLDADCPLIQWNQLRTLLNAQVKVSCQSVITPSPLRPLIKLLQFILLMKHWTMVKKVILLGPLEDSYLSNIQIRMSDVFIVHMLAWAWAHPNH